MKRFNKKGHFDFATAVYAITAGILAFVIVEKQLWKKLARVKKRNENSVRVRK